MGSTLELTGTINHFLNITPVAQTFREIFNKWDLLKMKNFCKSKDTDNKTKREPTECEKIITNPTLQRSYLQSIQRTQKIVIKTTNSPIKKMEYKPKKRLSTEESKMTERHLRKCSTSLVITEMQIKTTL